MVQEPISSDIEKLVLQLLIRNRIHFEFATSFRGGFYSLGGAVVDFLLPEERLAFRVQGEYWHRGVTKEGSDLIQREMLAEEGWTVVDLWGDDLKRDLEGTMRLAMQGQEVL